MPCEGCHVQFTVFRRKRSCTDCKRFYCSNCLTTSKRASSHIAPLCVRCSIFAKRPLLRADLLLLKPKDLIFYLQSQHISTTGCVEKDELVRLVLNHAQQIDAASPHNTGSSPSADADPTHSFEGLKQSCQNFFSNITENISDSFASFEGKTSSKSQPGNNGSGQRSQTPTSNIPPTHIFDQPRVSTREIPTYASYQNGLSGQSSPPPLHPTANTDRTTPASTTYPQSGQSRPASTSPSHNVNNINNSGSSQSASPVSSITSQPQVVTDYQQQRSAIDRETPNCEENQDGEKSDCDCSDDELIATFSERLPIKTQLDLLKRLEQVVGDPGMSSTSAASTGPGLSRRDKADICDGDESSQSSFEELGAIGGISDDSKAATDTNSSNIEQWQILDNQRMVVAGVTEQGRNEEDPVIDANKLQVALTQSQQPTVPQRAKKVARRRSDGYLNRHRPLSDDESPTGTDRYSQTIGEATILQEMTGGAAVPETDDSENQRVRSNCKRCGKNKTNIRRHVEIMRRHLESAQMSETDIKRELTEFLIYLEKRTKSIDSDSETAVSSFSASNSTQAVPAASSSQHLGSERATTSGYTTNGSRFINLENFDSLKELEYLTVKQLKEVLMLNRVDYKGCCEKQELLERVERLWTNLKSTPAADKLQTDELCKICMDAPIECVILECGHMATCTNCGKVLSECPICRQYIVRVVRFFRA